MNICPIVPGVNPVVVFWFSSAAIWTVRLLYGRWALRVNPIGTGTTMIPPSLQNPAPSHGAPPSNAPGIVNYRAPLSR
ncbi:hypothetical protein PGTUg99_000209 [Puccinia graminis f. sp. tritici]|uniref:Uncharacterized protein n=1 Tax=Puccinia graminis f. sp. tritici TaxID=56615 RepID=A0A5B0PT54_PUCGR|nr:hypothetical protein PGTUg99_000209 [Puccinia graminis f. sp. tritici]